MISFLSHLSRFRGTTFSAGLRRGCAQTDRQTDTMCTGLKKKNNEKEKLIPPVKDYMHEKDIFRWLHSEFSFFLCFWIFFYFVFTSSGRVFALELLRVALFKKKTESPLWSVELHQTQASSYKAVMFASKAQLCQRALQAPPLSSSLRDEKPAVDLCPSVAVRQLMVWASSRLFPSLMRFDRDCCSPVSLEETRAEHKVKPQHRWAFKWPPAPVSDQKQATSHF